MEPNRAEDELVLAEKKLTSVRRWLDNHIIKMENYHQKIIEIRTEVKNERSITHT